MSHRRLTPFGRHWAVARGARAAAAGYALVALLGVAGLTLSGQALGRRLGVATPVEEHLVVAVRADCLPSPTRSPGCFWCYATREGPTYYVDDPALFGVLRVGQPTRVACVALAPDRGTFLILGVRDGRLHGGTL